MVVNLFVGKYLTTIGETNILLFGSISNGFANIVFGFLIYLSNFKLFVLLCFVTRVIEGIGTACVTTTIYFLIVKTKTPAGTFEIYAGLSFVVGNLCGALFYQFLGFTLTFSLMGFIILACIPTAIIALKIIDRQIENNIQDKIDDKKVTVDDAAHSLTYFNLYKYP
ncbi:MFS-type transporter SLC18B1-like isoform X1, partial [Leptotrombidium deliense]